MNHFYTVHQWAVITGNFLGSRSQNEELRAIVQAILFRYPDHKATELIEVKIPLEYPEYSQIIVRTAKALRFYDPNYLPEFLSLHVKSGAIPNPDPFLNSYGEWKTFYTVFGEWWEPTHDGKASDKELPLFSSYDLWKIKERVNAMIEAKPCAVIWKI